MLVGLAVVWLVVGLWMVVLVPWDYPGDMPRVGAGSRQLGPFGIALCCAAWPVLALGWLCGIVTIGRSEGGE